MSFIGSGAGGSVPLGFDPMLAALKAAGEETRLRILALLAEGELSVSDLTDILGQSQPRISRHLKLMAEAGLVERQREGAWAFFRLARRPAGALARDLVERLAARDAILIGDRNRLADVRAARAKTAQAYFTRHARDWDGLRSLHVAEAEVETAILDAVGTRPFRSLLDVGTGTGRMLEILAPRATRAVGVDQSPAMLAVARARLATAGLRHVELQQGDIYALNIVEPGAFDLVVIHQVLHFLDDPARAVREAAQTLRPAGRLLVVDFAPHEIETLRADHAHRRLGFSREQIAGFMSEAGLEVVSHADLPPPGADAGKLTVSLWLGQDRRVIADTIPATPNLEIA